MDALKEIEAEAQSMGLDMISFWWGVNKGAKLIQEKMEEPPDGS